MNEYNIALKQVLPHLIDVYKWPKEFISNYGRVPVQIGTSIVWADFVCYINHDQKISPWLLIEVKQKKSLTEEAIAQAESYSILLGSPYFCVTEARRYAPLVSRTEEIKTKKISKFFEKVRKFR